MSLARDIGSHKYLGEIPLEIELGQIGAERLARRQAGFVADAVGERRRHHRHLRPEIACLVHAAHQTAGLLDAVAVKAQGGLIEGATAHGLDEIGCSEVMRLALRAPRHLRGQAQGHAGDDHSPQAAAPSA